MADAVTLIVLVAAGEASNAATRSLTRATREALGPSAHVAVHEQSTPPNDADARAIERAENADAVVELAWTDGHHRRATLRVHVAYDNRWLERSFGFYPSDAEFERGRALGFAIASLLPDRSKTSRSTAPDAGASPALPSAPGPAPGIDASAAFNRPATPTGNGAQPGTALPTAPEGGAPASAEPTVPPPSAAPTGPPASAAPTAPPAPTSRANPDGGKPPRAPSRAPSRSIEQGSGPPRIISIEGLAAAALPMDVDIGNLAFGGAVSALRPIAGALSFVSLRLSFGASRQPVARDVAMTSAFGSAGIAWDALRPSSRWPVGASIRADWILFYTWVSRRPGLTASEPHPNPLQHGPDVVLDIDWRLGPRIGLVFGGGAEFLVRPASIDLPENRVALPRWLGVIEAGFRVDF